MDTIGDLVEAKVTLTHEDRVAFNQYIPLCVRTMNTDLSDDQIESMLTMGMFGELGEIIDYLKKVYFHGKPLDRSVVIKEIGDVFWYLGCSVWYLNTTKYKWFLETNNCKENISPQWRPITWLQGNESLDLSNTDTPVFVCLMYDAIRFTNALRTKFPNSLYRCRKRNIYQLLHVFICLKYILSKYDITVQECLDANVKKLEARYPDGFSASASNNRKDQ